jgi:anti-sigma regulatory factor (Ser/Thr protein kinase)
MGRVLAIRPAASLQTALGAAIDLSLHSVERCDGNADAIRQVRERAVDVVITDAFTSVVEDLALASELQRVRPAVRVIVLAPAVSQAHLVDAMRAHVFACFSSPFDDGDIASMVRGALLEEVWRDGIQVLSGLPHWLTLRVSCHLVTADRLVRFMTELQPSIDGGERDLLITAFREMLLNAMEHGAGFDPDQVIEVTAARTGRAIVYHIRDPGRGFSRSTLDHTTPTSDPDAVIATAMRRAEMGLRPGGFGMLIVRQVVDEVVYNEAGNEVLLIKYLDGPGSSG